MISRFKQTLLGLVGAFAIIAVVAAPAGAHGFAYQTATVQPNIVEKALAINKESGEFSTLIAAASCTNIAARLSDNSRSYTLFAPTDAAFAKLNLNKDNVCSSFKRHQLTNILKYHIVRGEVTAVRVLASSSLNMLNGQPAVISGATIDGQNIVQTDVLARNGVIHAVDGVLLP